MLINQFMWMFTDYEILNSVQFILLAMFENNLTISWSLMNYVNAYVASDTMTLYNTTVYNSAITINITDIRFLTVNITSICSGVMTTFYIGNIF